MESDFRPCGTLKVLKKYYSVTTVFINVTSMEYCYGNTTMILARKGAHKKGLWYE